MKTYTAFSYIYTDEKSGKTTSEIMVTSDEERIKAWTKSVDQGGKNHRVVILKVFRSLASLKSFLRFGMNADVKFALSEFYKRRRKNPTFHTSTFIIDEKIESVFQPTVRL